MQAQPTLMVQKPGAWTTRSGFVLFMCALFLAGCSGLPKRTAFSPVDINQRAPSVDYQPYEYIFCPDLGAVGACVPPSPKTPSKVVGQVSVETPDQGEVGVQVSTSRRVEAVLTDEDDSGEYVPTIKIADVRFQFNSSVLSPAAQGQLLDVIPALKGRDIFLFGYTDSIGGQAYNDRLAIQRAHSVRQFLLRSGLAGQDIAIAGKGLCCYLASNNTDESRAQNRRVEIHLPEDSQ